MRRHAVALIALIGSLAIVAGCATPGGRPGWTYAPPRAAASPGADPAAHMMSNAPQASAPAAVAGGPIVIESYDLGFKPASVSVPAPGRYELTLKNTGVAVHDVTLPDGTTIVADPGASATGTIDVPAGGTTFLCSIPGHAAAGMTGTIAVAGATPSAAPTANPGGGTAAAPVADPAAPAYVLRDPKAPPVLSGTVHDIDMPIVEKDITVAEGFVVHAWTFGGTVPGPVIRVHLGDTVRVHLTNTGKMSHSIDFHASETAMNRQMVEIKPGGTFTYTFTANYAGVWMYHCGTPPALHHIANGMFGMVIVEPEGGLPKVDEEFAFVQSEWYLGPQKEPVDYTKAFASAPAPDFVVFNGIANQYKDSPIQVTTQGRVRVFVLNAGPSVDSSFHVVGTVFDTVVKEGVALVRGNAGGWGAQAADLSPAQGAVIEFSPVEDGMYPLVTHAFNFVGRGALGLFMAGDGDPLN